MEDEMRLSQTTKRAPGACGDRAHLASSITSSPGACSYATHEAMWIGRVNSDPRRTMLDVVQDDVSERHEMLDAFDAAFAGAADGEDEWTTLMRAAGAVRDVKAWYGLEGIRR